MTTTNNKKSNIFKTAKAILGLLVLSAASMRTLILESKGNTGLVIGVGTVAILFCILSVTERLFTKE